MYDFRSVLKDSPSMGDVHVATALGNSGKTKKPKNKNPKILAVGGFRGGLLNQSEVAGGSDSLVLVKHDLPAVRAYLIHGIPIEIETPKGHRRIEPAGQGVYHDVTFSQDYGRIPWTVGADGDQVDVYVGDNHDSDKLWVINQLGPTGDFDEIKACMGFASRKESRAAYLQSHADGLGRERIGEMLRTTYPDFQKWLDEGDTCAPYPGGELFAAWPGTAMDKRAMPEGVAGRKLEPYRGLAKNPLSALRHPLAQVRPHQLPRFLGALTNPDALDKRKMRIADLTALQDRVDPHKVAAMMAPGYDTKKRPVVVRFGQRDYVADGNHRIAARWLQGKETVKVRYLNLTQRAAAAKREAAWSLPMRVMKADPDRQMIFGWASISTEDGKLVVDKQQEMIEPDQLENAAYEFVLEARENADMHQKRQVGRLIESMMFTTEKQDALGIKVMNDAGQRIEGWWTGFLVDDKETWKAHKRGERPEFSIGGVAQHFEA